MSVFRIILGRSAAYFVLYMALGALDLILIPRLFGLPHIGNPTDILRFMVPYLLAVIYFSMCISVFTRNRETGLVTLISSTLIFLFIAGVSWPQQMLPKAWLYLSYFIPYTWGVHGYLHISSMGATLACTSKEYYALWILSAVYFVLACGLLWVLGWRETHRSRQSVAAA